MEPVVAELRGRGLEVLLAHPERSPAFMRGPRPLERLVAMGALTQLTSTSFSGRFGEPARRAAFAMLERGQGHVIASDAHGADGRPPDLLCALGAFEQRYEAPRALFDWMTVDLPRAILDGRPAPPRPPLPRRRGLLKRLTS
jgi:protein-tyrosine phosphatase